MELTIKLHHARESWLGCHHQCRKHHGTLKVWDLETGRAVRTLEVHAGWFTGVAVTMDGEWAVSAWYHRTMKVWDLESGRALLTLEGHSDRVFGVAVTGDGKRAVSASRDGTLKVWDLESEGALHGRALLRRVLHGRAPLRRALRTLEGHSGYVTGVAVTRDGRRVVSASEDKTLKAWDLESGRELLTLEGYSSHGVAVTGDGKRAVAESGDGTLRVWDLGSGALAATFYCDATAQRCACASSDLRGDPARISD